MNHVYCVMLTFFFFPVSSLWNFKVFSREQILGEIDWT